MRDFLQFLILLSALVNAERLSEMKDKSIQSRCGRKPSQQKMMNGKEMKYREYLWSVPTYTRFFLKSEAGTKRKFTISPGTFISDSHILVFNFIRYINNSLNFNGIESLNVNGTCEGSNRILPPEFNNRFDYDFEYDKPYNKKRHYYNTVEKVIIIDGCEHLLDAKLMILDLKEVKVINDSFRPVCLLKSPKIWNEVDEFVVHGTNKEGMLNSAPFAPSNCSLNPPFSCANVLNRTKEMCKRDRGGSAIGRINNRHYLLGLYLKGTQDCTTNLSPLKDYEFINIGYYKKQICEATGICEQMPSEKEEKEEEEGNMTNMTSESFAEIYEWTTNPDIVDSNHTIHPVASDSTTEIFTTFGPTPVDNFTEEPVSTESAEDTETTGIDLISTTTTSSRKTMETTSTGSKSNGAPVNWNGPTKTDKEVLKSEVFGQMHLNKTIIGRNRNINIYINLNNVP